MILTSTLDAWDVECIVNRVSRENYEGNLACGPYAVMYGEPRLIKEMKDGRLRLSFCLRVRDCTKKGARRTFSGKRWVGASWQAHYDVMDAIFQADPEAHLKTGLETYDGRTDFRVKAPDTYYHNVGSMVNPMCIGDMDV